MAGGAAEPYVEAFEELTSDTSTPAWVQSMRRAAFERFGVLGFPTTKNEDWHFTSVSPIADQDYVFLAAKSGDVARDELAPFMFGATGWYTMVFVNGRFTPELSDIARLPSGVKLWDLASAWTKAPDVVDRVGKLASYDNQSFGAQHRVHARRRRDSDRQGYRGRSADPRRVCHRRRGGEGDDASAESDPRRAQRQGDGDRELRVDHRRGVSDECRHRSVGR
jgi:hypothetical protein